MKTAARTIFVAEPAAQYRVRPPIVVDCSLLCAVLFDEAERGDAEHRLSGRQLLAPTLLAHEIANVAVKKARRGMPAEVVERALADFEAQAIELIATPVAEQCALALHCELSAYDAAYLWLAAELKLPLVTFDRKLGEAAQRHLGAME